jgi:hypothetical protein
MPLISTFGGLTAQSFGGKIAIGGSAFFDTQGDVLFTSPGTPFAYGLGDFTIEMWFYPTSFAGNRVLWHQGGQSTTSTSTNILTGQRTTTFTDRRYLTLYLNSAGQASMEVFGNSAYRTTSNTATLNSWNHVALVRSGGNVRIFLNGNPTDPAGLSGSNFTDTSVYTPCIGRFSYGSLGFTGYITNVRVAKSAYYSTAFNPARTPFTRNSQGASSVQLLLNHLNSTRFLTDSSVNNLTVTNSGTFFNNLSPYNSQYLPFAPVSTVSAVITPSATLVNEGDTITFSVTGTNTTNGTYYYTIEQPVGDLTGTDFTSGSLSGTFSISGNSGSFPLTSVRDLSTEGDSTFAVYVRSGSITGPVLGTSAEITLTDSSLTPEFTATPASINEGDSGTFTVANVGADGTYFWTILNGTTASADFNTTSGSFLVSGSTGGIDNGTGSFNITTVADRVTEGSQTFQVQVRSGSTSGTVVVTSSSVTINDISLTPFANFTSSPNIAELTGNNGGYSTSTTIQVGNLGPAGTYYWSIVNNQGTLTASDLTAGSLTGSFTTSTLNGTANLTFTAAPDTVAETSNGLNIFQVQIREGSTTGTILTTSGNIQLFDSSVVISALAPNPASEGNGFNITVSTNLFQSAGVAPGLYFLTFESTSSASAADVAGLPFAFNITSQGNYFLNGLVSVVSLDGAETFETFRIGVRQGTTTGPLVGLSDIITINSSVT